MGVPAVVSDIPAHREVGGEVPIYVDPLSAASGWSAAIASLLDNEQRRQTMSRRGTERAAAYTWDGVATQLGDAALALGAQCGDRV
jgi:glycosyltransferase involved in cell wall biosynthesis